MPQLQDPNFARAVVLLCDYMPDGAFGLVLNRPTELPASTMVKLEPAVAEGNALPLCIGGPVEPDRGWILLADAPEEPGVPHDLRRGLPLDLARSAAARPVDVSRAPRRACSPATPGGAPASSTPSSPSRRGSSARSTSTSSSTSRQG